MSNVTYTSWSTEDVVAFMEKHRLHDVARIFKENGVTGSDLVQNIHVMDRVNMEVHERLQRALGELNASSTDSNNSKRREHQLTGAQKFVASGVATMIARTITSPLEVVKVVEQVGPSDPFAHWGFWHDFFMYRQMYDAGLSSFFRGTSLYCLNWWPVNGISISTYNISKRIFIRPRKRKPTYWESTVLATVSTVIATAVTEPLVTIRTRLIVYPHLYTDALNCAKLMISGEGWTSLFSGLIPAILANLGLQSVSSYVMLTSSALQFSYPQQQNRMSQHLDYIIQGCISSVVAQICTFPFETLRRLMHAERSNGSIISVLVYLVKTRGLLSLYNGLTSALLKVVPFTVASLVAYGIMKNIFLYINGYTMGPFDPTPKPGVNQGMKPHELKHWYAEINKPLAD